jgi:hypothetical protein
MFLKGFDRGRCFFGRQSCKSMNNAYLDSAPRF